MGNSFHRRPQADLDLDSVWDFIAAANVSAADSLLDRIGRSLQMLADNPKPGRAKPELGQQMRSLAVGNDVIFYIAEPSGVDVVRVRNGRQDISAEDME